MYASDVSKGIFAISFVPTAYSYKKYTSTRKKYLYDDGDDLKYLTIKSSGSGMCRSDILSISQHPSGRRNHLPPQLDLERGRVSA